MANGEPLLLLNGTDLRRVGGLLRPTLRQGPRPPKWLEPKWLRRAGCSGFAVFYRKPTALGRLHRMGLGGWGGLGQKKPPAALDVALLLKTKPSSTDCYVLRFRTNMICLSGSGSTNRALRAVFAQKEGPLLRREEGAAVCVWRPPPLGERERQRLGDSNY